MTLRTPLLGLGLFAIPLFAVAHNNNPQAEDLIKFGGHLDVLAVQCFRVSAEEPRQAQENQQSFSVQEFGVIQHDFQTLFSQRLNEAQAERDNNSPMERRTTCDNVNDLDGVGEP